MQSVSHLVTGTLGKSSTLIQIHKTKPYIQLFSFIKFEHNIRSFLKVLPQKFTHIYIHTFIIGYVFHFRAKLTPKPTMWKRRHLQNIPSYAQSCFTICKSFPIHLHVRHNGGIAWLPRNIHCLSVSQMLSVLQIPLYH